MGHGNDKSSGDPGEMKGRHMKTGKGESTILKSGRGGGIESIHIHSGGSRRPGGKSPGLMKGRKRPGFLKSGELTSGNPLQVEG